MKNDEFEDDFKNLLDLYLKGRLPATEKARLEKQLDDFKKQDPTPYDFSQQNSDDLWKKISGKTITKPATRGRLWISVAAAVIFASVAVLLLLAWDQNTPPPSNKIILADGTIVWLKNNATLDYSKLTPENRQVTLSGEALFEVARVREHPFVIHCGSYEARVLGTSFNLKANDSTVELTVLTGTVQLSSLKTDSTVLVNPHEHVLFTERTVNRILSDMDDVRSLIANTQYDMHFEDTRMDDVVRRVEGKFNVTITLENSDIGNCMISADFTDQSLPLTLEMISEALGFQYTIDEDHVIISGIGCAE